MRALRVGLGILVAAILMVGVTGVAGPARSQSDPEVAALRKQVKQLHSAGKYAEGLAAAQRYVIAAKKKHGENAPEFASAITWQALLLMDTNRLAEAEPLMRRALAIDEKSHGPNHASVATSLNNLGELLRRSNRFAEAEPLMRRALAIDEKSHGPNHASVATNLNNLAQLLQDTKRLSEAEPLMRRALAITEKSKGADHPDVAIRLNNLAGLLWETNRPAEAEPLFRRVLPILEKSLGPEHPKVATIRNNLAMLLKGTFRVAEAEPFYRRALAISEKSLGPEHPSVAVTLNNLAYMRAEVGDWAESAQLHRRAKPIMTGVYGKEGDGLSKAMLTRNTMHLRASARAVHRSGGSSAAAREEGFELAQWALQTGAADALAQMSVRFAKGAGPLAQLVRERQDLISRRQGEDSRLLAAVGAADAKAAGALRGSIDDINRKLNAIAKKLASEFPEYASLASPKPLTIAAVQGLLKAEEALVLFLDVPPIGKQREETLAWAVTKTESRWISIPDGTDALADRVATLRCGLDRQGSWAWAGRSGRWLAKSERCRQLKPDGLGADEPLPFDLDLAHVLYAKVLEPFADLTKNKSLIIVPSGALTSLPFHVLVAEAPKAATFRTAAWLALKQPITVLPSVGSLQALRKLPPSEAKEPYIAFGNPLLDGTPPNGEPARTARAKQTCPQDLESQRQRVAATTQGIPGLGTIFRGGSIDVAALRAQAPLPETADELCAVAKALGALGRERDTVWLGARATETNLKALSREGKLAHYQVLHFATHGLLAGESEEILKAKAEPALLLTPPKEGANKTGLEHDDGVLTASEVAQLHLDADWVVLSACNTAAGDKGDAEAFAGLARAFFYAKARALLVSHWAVDSEATVELIAKTFAALRTDPHIGRAEALRRSMLALISKGDAHAHPATWAPFVLVGEGAGQGKKLRQEDERKEAEGLKKNQGGTITTRPFSWASTPSASTCEDSCRHNAPRCLGWRYSDDRVCKLFEQETASSNRGSTR